MSTGFDFGQVEWSKSLFGLDKPTSQVQVEHFWGQDTAKQQIAPFMGREESMPPILLLGEPGMGKTRFAQWVATQRGERFESVLCPVSNGSSFPPNGVLLLDEVHLLKKPEWLFGRLEARDGLSIIAATTRPSQLEPALKSRFFVQLHLEAYRHSDLVQMIAHHLPDATEETVDVYAGGAAGNARQAMRIVETARAVGDVNDVETVMSACRLTRDGLSEFQLRYLLSLSSSPIGLEQVALLLFSDKETVRVMERHLIHKGLVELTTQGRRLTAAGLRAVRNLRGE